MTSILVIHTGGLGDFLQILPVLAGLRARWPAARITIVGRPDRAVLAREAKLTDNVFDFDASGLHRLFAPDAAFDDVPALLQSCDIVLNFLPHDALSANLARLTHARVLHAVSFPARGACSVPAARFVYDQLAPQLGLPPGDTVPRLQLPHDHLARRAMAQEFPDAGRAVAIHPGSGSPKKNWPLDRFMELASLLRREGIPVLWLLGPAEIDTPGAMLSLAEAQRRSRRRSVGAKACEVALSACATEQVGIGPTVSDMLLSSAPLIDVAAVLSLVRGYVGNDSGITHLAAALGTPTVALFGPSDTAVWAPRGARVRVLAAEGADLTRLAAAEVLRGLFEPLDNPRPDGAA